jgi:hypothetical protein
MFASASFDAFGKTLVLRLMMKAMMVLVTILHNGF